MLGSKWVNQRGSWDLDDGIEVSKTQQNIMKLHEMTGLLTNAKKATQVISDKPWTAMMVNGGKQKQNKNNKQRFEKVKWQKLKKDGKRLNSWRNLFRIKTNMLVRINNPDVSL